MFSAVSIGVSLSSTTETACFEWGFFLVQLFFGHIFEQDVVNHSVGFQANIIYVERLAELISNCVLVETQKNAGENVEFQNKTISNSEKKKVVSSEVVNTTFNIFVYFYDFL